MSTWGFDASLGRLRKGFLLVCATSLVACAVVQTAGMQGSIGPQDSIALLPITNLTDVPQAGLRAESITEATLRARGLRQLQIYPPQLSTETLFEPSQRKAQLEAEKWAKAQGIRFVVYGSVDEWRYKIGVDGEPAVGLVYHLKDLQSNQVVFSSSGGRTGYSREALSAVAQKLAVQLLQGIAVGQGGSVTVAPAALPLQPAATPSAPTQSNGASAPVRSR